MNRVLVIAMLCSVHVIYGQTSVTAHLDKVWKAEAFDYASVGLSVRSMDGNVEVDYNADRKLIPASSLKLITTLSTIKILGGDYTFKTKLGYTGSIDESGYLEGNIVIIGSGDPTLGSDRMGLDLDLLLSEITKSIKTVGIKCIDGGIEVRTNVFQGQATPANWPHSDLSNYYGSGAWALNYAENTYQLAFAPTKKEAVVAQVSAIRPDVPGLSVRSEVATKGPNSGDNAYIYGDPFHYQKVVRGSIPRSSKEFLIKGSIPNPPLSFAATLGRHLESTGVFSQSIQVVDSPIKKTDFHLLETFVSAPLKEIVKEANHESINLYCEALLRLIGKHQKNVGSIDGGLEVVEEEMTKLGIDQYSYHIEDGSGLSPRNSITPNTFTQYLASRYRTMDFKMLQELIPQAGVSGTVASVMSGKPGQKKFYLKSGSMGGVLSYTGYFQAKSGTWYCLSFISNNHSHGNRAVRLAIEKGFAILYDHL